MANWLDNVERGEIPDRPLEVVVYGTEGVGKSTFASNAPEPIFLDAERGTLGLDVNRLHVTNWIAFLEMLRTLLQAKHGYRTVVLDTLDALERLLCGHVCQISGNVGTIEDVGGGFGKGWTRVAEEWSKVLALLDQLQAQRGMNVVMLAHADATRFADPDGADYNRWTLRLNKKSTAAIKGWCEELLFATRAVTSTKKDKGKGRGGERVLYTEWSPGREAKNRHNLPARLPLDWNAFANALHANVRRVEATRPQQEAAVEETPPVNVDPNPTIPPGQGPGFGGADDETKDVAYRVADLVKRVEEKIGDLDQRGLHDLAKKSRAYLDAENRRDTGKGLAVLIERQDVAIKAEDDRVDAEAAAAEAAAKEATREPVTTNADATEGFELPAF